MKVRLRTLLGLLLLPIPTARALPVAAEISAAFKAIDTNRNGAPRRAMSEQVAFELFHLVGKDRDNSFIPAEVGTTPSRTLLYCCRRGS